MSWELQIVPLAEQDIEEEFIYCKRLREGEQ
jgi:hypothetical protein